MNLFAQAVCEVLETGSVGLDDDFRGFGGWCSLQGFGLLVMMENDWNAPLGIERFLSLSTVRDLYREAFVALAAEVFGVDRAELSGDTARGGIVQWDSVNHLRLVMEAEKRFGTSYPIEMIPSLKRIDDFLI
jgi:acyl carrier protein